MKHYSLILALLLAATALTGSVAAAEALIKAIDLQAQSDSDSAAAQQSVDTLNTQTQRMLEEYRDALRKTEALNAYNDHLRRLVASQQEEKQSLEKQLGEIEQTRRGIVPLMLRMTDTLERFVNLDRPFFAELRKQRTADLKTLMTRADVGDAEKFRRVLEAYQIENEYGKTIDAYRAELKIGDKDPRTVDFLRVGRVALLYQTLDGRETGLWNKTTNRWETLPSEYIKPVREGLAVARQESPPELLRIAIETPEAVQ